MKTYLDMGHCFLTAFKVKETNRLETLLNASIRVACSIKRPVNVLRYNLHCNSKNPAFLSHRTYFLLTIV